MLKLVRKAGILGTGAVLECSIDPLPGESWAALVERVRLPAWSGMRIGIAIDGRKLEGEELAEKVRDGATVVVAPDPEGFDPISILVYAAVSALISAGLSLAMSALMPTPKAPNVEQQRGDETSATYAYDGVRTTQGQGLPIAQVYGLHGVGGHIINAAVLADTLANPGREVLRIVLALADGRCHAIGGVTGGATGEVDALGGFPGGISGGSIPEGIQVNGTTLDASNPLPGVRTWIRLGELDQSPLPAPFVGTSIVDVVGAELRNANDEHVYTIDDEDEITQVSFVLSAPGGIYRNIAGTRFGSPVDLWVGWRPQGTTTWRPFQGPRGPFNGYQFASSAFSSQQYSETVVGDLGGPESGPLEIRIARVTASYGADAIDLVLWRQVEWSSPHVFSYPRMSLVGFEFESTELVHGETPQFVVPISGRRVKVWDATNGWSPECWDVPPAPWNYYANPVGRNPAWIAVAFLLDRQGLGRRLNVSRLDLDSFARWAAYCDLAPGPVGDLWDGPRYQCGLVVDSPGAAWDRLRRICFAGGAWPVINGDKVSIVFGYRDAFTLGPITVPARVRTQFFASSAIRDVRVDYINVRRRPTVIRYQFRDESAGWVPDEFQVEDPESGGVVADTFDPVPYNVAAIDAIGVTSRAQLFRMGIRSHAINRLASTRITFKVAAIGLFARPGNVVGVQTDVLRPWDVDPVGLTIAAAVSSSLTVTLDRAVTLPAGKTMSLLSRDAVGDVVEATITSPAGDYAAGATITLATAVTLAAGTTAALGVQEQIATDYEITSVSIDRDFSATVQGVKWAPEAYDDPSPSDYDAGAFVSTLGVGSGDFGQSTTTPPAIDPTTIRIQPAPDRRGVYFIEWARASGSRGLRARVFLRPSGAVSWALAGESVTERLRIEIQLRPFAVYDVAVVLERVAGIFAGVTDGDVATLTVPEFPPQAPASVTGATLRACALGVVIAWRPVDEADLQVEIRCGTDPISAQLVAVTRGGMFIDHAAGRVALGASYWLAAVDRLGMYSREWIQAEDVDNLAASWRPDDTRDTVADSGDVIADESATLNGLEFETDENEPDVIGARLQALESDGYVRSPEIILLDDDSFEFEARAYWSATVGGRILERITVDDVSDLVDSGESFYRRVDSREASLGSPGISDVLVDDAPAMTVDELDSAGFDAGYLTLDERGHRARILLESRFQVDGVYSSWAPHVDGRRRASRMQVRARVSRESFSLLPYVTTLRGVAFL